MTTQAELDFNRTPEPATTPGNVAEPKKPKRLTKTDRVAMALNGGNTLTPLDGLFMFGTFRLASIIRNLRKRGFIVKTDMVEVQDKEGRKARVARYSLGTPETP